MQKYDFVTLSEDEFNDFAVCHKHNNFFQSIYMKKLLEKENRKVYLLGLKDKNKNIVAATLLASSSSFLGYTTYEALKGYLIDYENEELVVYFTERIKEFIKKKKCYRLIIDPYIPRVQRDINAEIVENGFDNEYVVKYLNNLGFKEVKNSVQVKWTFVLDTNKSIEELESDMKPNTRNRIHKTINKYKLVIDELTYEELDVFKKITQDTCNRRGFKDRTLEYYQNMYNIFKDSLKVLVCKLDCDLYLKSLNEDKEQLNRKINELSDSASNKKKKETYKNDIENIDKNIKEVKELKKENGKYVILSGAMFVLYGDEIVYLFSGSYDEYMKYCGQYRLQYEMIKYAANNHYKRYNFYGIKDVFDKNGKDYGVYEFKKGFNGYVEELLGAYELGVNYIYAIYHLLKIIKR